METPLFGGVRGSKMEKLPPEYSTNALLCYCGWNVADFLDSIWYFHHTRGQRVDINSQHFSKSSPNYQANDKTLACLSEIKKQVSLWIRSHHAWDQRKHPAIQQFLCDIEAHCLGSEPPGGVPLLVITMELDRLSRKIVDLKVDEAIGHLKAALTEERVHAIRR